MPPRDHQRGIHKKLRSGLNESSLVARAYLRLHIYQSRPGPAESMEEEADSCSAEKDATPPWPGVYISWQSVPILDCVSN